MGIDGSNQKSENDFYNIASAGNAADFGNLTFEEFEDIKNTQNKYKVHHKHLRKWIIPSDYLESCELFKNKLCKINIIETKITVEEEKIEIIEEAEEPFTIAAADYK